MCKQRTWEIMAEIGFNTQFIDTSHPHRTDDHTRTAMVAVRFKVDTVTGTAAHSRLAHCTARTAIVAVCLKIDTLPSTFCCAGGAGLLRT
jgi:hypothetical protein